MCRCSVGGATRCPHPCATWFRSLALLLLLLAGGWGASDYHSCIGFNSCTMYFDGPPYSVVCPWLALAGLLFTCESLTAGLARACKSPARGSKAEAPLKS
jgi:hypothetical protein